MSIINQLSGGDRRSIGRVDQIVVQVQQNPAFFAELMAGWNHPDEVVRMRPMPLKKYLAASQNYYNPIKKLSVRCFIKRF